MPNCCTVPVDAVEDAPVAAGKEFRESPEPEVTVYWFDSLMMIRTCSWISLLDSTWWVM